MEINPHLLTLISYLKRKLTEKPYLTISVEVLSTKDFFGVKEVDSFTCNIPTELRYDTLLSFSRLLLNPKDSFTEIIEFAKWLDEKHITISPPVPMQMYTDISFSGSFSLILSREF